MNIDFNKHTEISLEALMQAQTEARKRHHQVHIPFMLLGTLLLNISSYTPHP